MEPQCLSYGNEDIDYVVFRTKRISKKVAIHVHPGGFVQVEAPKENTITDIRHAVQKRARWIYKQVSLAREVRAHVLPREYVSGETHFYLGRRYKLQVDIDNKEENSVKLQAGRICVSLQGNKDGLVKRKLQLWYKKRAEEYFSKRILVNVEQISWIKTVPKLRLSNMQKQWGNCSPTGVISLNPALIKAPRECINYVIIHELCHLKEHNHSKRYYELLEKHCPNWEPVKAKLDSMAELLLAS